MMMCMAGLCSSAFGDIQCPMGSEWAETEQTCVECKVGYFKQSWGSALCNKCSEGKTSGAFINVPRTACVCE